MLNEMLSAISRYDMIAAGDTVICAVSGGADSVALLRGMLLLRERLGIRLEAAHLNHCLRGEESLRDENFVRDLCDRWDIPLHIARVSVVSGEKGLEAAAREARYLFFAGLSGKIATAHTADDNAETVLMHLTRGTGLKGLCAIAPVNGKIIRPMLDVTRGEVLRFLQEQDQSFVQDSSNDTDDFFRNRVRHNAIPLFQGENPQFVPAVSSMAQRLRQDNDYLWQEARRYQNATVEQLRQLHPAIRDRVLENCLKEWGLTDIQGTHIAGLNALVQSRNPSARISLPGGLTVARNYDRLVRIRQQQTFSPVELPCPGSVRIPELNLLVTCTEETESASGPEAFTVNTRGPILLRPRSQGDSLRLGAGTKTLKKAMIDKKIPACTRNDLPVAVDAQGVLGVYGIGGNLDRLDENGVTIRFIKE